MLIVDPVPATIPFGVTQSPLCSTVSLTYSLTYDTGAAAPVWISATTGTHLNLTPSSLGALGNHAFELVATEVISGVLSPITAISIELDHPCETTAVTAIASIPDQTLFAWQFATNSNLMSFSVPFSEFACDVTTNFGVDCGAFVYSVSPVALVPDEPAILASLSIDSVG